MAITIKTPEEIEGMRKACQLASQVLDYITPFVVAGAKTIDLDQKMNEFIVANGAVSACLGYAPKGFTPYPGATCISINHVVCHGIPSEKTLKKGDILNIDVTVILNGYYGDTSRMFTVGNKVCLIHMKCCSQNFNISRCYRHCSLYGLTLWVLPASAWLAPKAYL